MRRSASVGWSGGLMGGYVEIGALNTWYDEQGEGEPLVLLEGCAPTQHGLPRCRRLVRTFGSSHRSAAVMGTHPISREPCPMTSCRRTRLGFWMRSSVAPHIWWDGAT